MSELAATLKNVHEALKEDMEFVAKTWAERKMAEFEENNVGIT